MGSFYHSPSAPPDSMLGDRRLRSDYLVYYRWLDGHIVRQEIHYDPSAPPDVLAG